MATQLQKQVDKQKKEAEKKFSSWFMNKFTGKKNKTTQYIRDQDERTAETERLRRQKASTSSSSSSSSPATTSNHPSKRDPIDDRKSLQRQQSFLRAQLLEMKRHSHEVLRHAKSKGDSSDEEEYDDVHSELGDDDEILGSNNHSHNSHSHHAPRKSKSRTRMRRSSSSGNQHKEGVVYDTDDEDEEKKGYHSEDEDNNKHHHDRNSNSLRNSFTSGAGSQRNSLTDGTGSQRNSISDELDRRTSRATMLYEEAIHALEDVLHPPDRLSATTRMRRSDSASKKVFARPESEWI